MKGDGKSFCFMMIFENPRLIELSAAILMTKEFVDEPTYALISWDEGWEHVLPDADGMERGMLDQQKAMGGGVVYHLKPDLPPRAVAGKPRSEPGAFTGHIAR